MTLRRPNFYQVLSTGYYSESTGDAHMSQGPSLRLFSNHSEPSLLGLLPCLPSLNCLHQDAAHLQHHLDLEVVPGPLP